MENDSKMILIFTRLPMILYYEGLEICVSLWEQSVNEPTAIRYGLYILYLVSHCRMYKQLYHLKLLLCLLNLIYRGHDDSVLLVYLYICRHVIKAKIVTSLIETMLQRKQTQSTRNHSQQASKSQAKVLNLSQPQKAE